MKRTLLLLAALMLAAASASAQFEGVADLTMTMGTSGAGTGKMAFGPGGYRLDWSMSLTSTSTARDGGKSKAPAQITMSMLGRKGEPGRVYILSDADKSYSILDADKASDAQGRTPEEYRVQKLGTSTVAGLSCQNLLVTSSNGTQIEACLSKDLQVSSDWLAAVRRRQNDAGSWLAMLKEKGAEGFPVRWSVRKKGSTEALATMEITHIEKKSVPAAFFDIPAGYKETQSAQGGLTPEQRKAMAGALQNMTPEQRKAYEDAMKRYVQPTPKP